MHLNDDPISLYDVLELTPDATPQEIRSAYLRLKSSYSKDNIAHYTLFSREETESMLQKIENAYLMLSNPERRRAYDQGEGHSHSAVDENQFAFQGTPSANLNASPVINAMGGGMSGGMNVSASASSSSGLAAHSVAAQPTASSAPFSYGAHSIESNLATDVDLMIQNEQEWGGASLRRIREARRMSLDDLADYTRISKSYLRAIEEEDYNRLPAVVYVRGFLQQVAKRLKLPIEIVIQKYLDRFKTARPDKA
jgi:curved DNA-binding protein CbpA